MGNGSPSEDEIRRVNECLDKCRDDNFAIQTKYVQLFTEKKLTDKQAKILLDEAERRHDECTARCVPQRRRFTDPQKDDFSDGGTALVIAGGLGVIGGIGAETIFKAPEVGSVIYSISATVLLFSFVAGKLQRCPIDPHFSKVPIPSFPTASAVRPAKNSGLTRSVAEAANAVLANQAETLGLLNALLTALDRAEGAARAGDTSAEEMQVNAARDFAKKVVEVFKKATSLRLSLASKWTGPDLDFTISEQDAVNLRDETIINGFPSPFLKALRKLETDPHDQDLILQSLILTLVNLPDGKQIRFRDLLIDPQWRAGETKLISSLRKFSRSH